METPERTYEKTVEYLQDKIKKKDAVINELLERNVDLNQKLKKCHEDWQKQLDEINNE